MKNFMVNGFSKHGSIQSFYVQAENQTEAKKIGELLGIWRGFFVKKSTIPGGFTRRDAIIQKAAKMINRTETELKDFCHAADDETILAAGPGGIAYQYLEYTGSRISGINWEWRD